jgi:hypothetical protein
MAFSTGSVKLRSLKLWPILLTAASLGLGGCVFVDDRDDGMGGYAPPPPQSNVEPMLVSIDADATITAEPGEGVGLFVEYAAGGTWRIWSTCDTNYSNVACVFDVAASVDDASELTDVFGEDLDGHDEIGFIDFASAYMHAEVSSDIDGMKLITTPGAILRVETYLDGVPQPRFVYWFGDGVLHTGAPTNPVDFEPSAP